MFPSRISHIYFKREVPVDAPVIQEQEDGSEEVVTAVKSEDIIYVVASPSAESNRGPIADVVIDQFGGYCLVDLQQEINLELGISPAINFLVLKIRDKESEGKPMVWSIAKRCLTPRHGSEMTHSHWGHVDLEKYTFPSIEHKPYVRVINNADIIMCVGKFSSLEEAVNQFNISKGELCSRPALRV